MLNIVRYATEYQNMGNIAHIGHARERSNANGSHF